MYKLNNNCSIKDESSYYQCVWSKIFVGFLAFVCYANSFWGQFVFDDSEAILGNKDVNTDSSVLQIFSNDFWGMEISSNNSHKSYRPLTTLTFRLNFWLAGGLESTHFHAVNIILHVLVSLLYFKTCNTLAINLTSTRNYQYKSLSPFISALLFSTHPVHTENVAGIVGRAELMSALCFFLAMLCYVEACNNEDSVCRMVFWLLLVVLLSGCALLFKEQGVTVVGVCIVYDVIIKMRCDPVCFFKCKFPSTKEVSYSRFAVRVFVMIAATLAMLIARFSTGSPTFKPIDNAASFADSLTTRVLSYNYIYALNGWLLLNPWWLCFDWSMGCIPLIESFTDYRIVVVAVFWIFFGTLIAYCLLGEKGPLKRLVTVSLTMVVIPFLPASNLFLRVGFVIAERVLYLPSAGYCILVSLGVVTLMNHFNKKILSGLMLVITLFMIRSVLRSSMWLSEENLFVSGLTVCPHNAKVLYNIGKVKSDSGDTISGIAAYREAIRLYPEYDQALNNLGNLLKGQGANVDAEELFHRAIKANHKFPAAWMNLGIVQATLGKTKEAEESYMTAINQRKKHPDAYYNLGNLYIELGRHDDAIAAYNTAITLKKDHVSAWNNMGLLYENLQRHDKAEEVMRRAIAEVPNVAQFYSSLGIFLGRQNRLEEGEKMLKKAISIDSNSGNYHANLGVIYHLRKDYKRAEECYLLALKLEPSSTLARDNFNKLMSIRKSKVN